MKANTNDTRFHRAAHTKWEKEFETSASTAYTDRRPQARVYFETNGMRLRARSRIRFVGGPRAPLGQNSSSTTTIRMISTLYTYYTYVQDIPIVYNAHLNLNSQTHTRTTLSRFIRIIFIDEENLNGSRHFIIAPRVLCI